MGFVSPRRCRKALLVFVYLEGWVSFRSQKLLIKNLKARDYRGAATRMLLTESRRSKNQKSRFSMDQSRFMDNWRAIAVRQALDVAATI